MFHLQSTNSTNKESTSMKAEFTAMIEAAKSKMHQVRAVSIMNVEIQCLVPIYNTQI